MKQSTFTVYRCLLHCDDIRSDDDTDNVTMKQIWRRYYWQPVGYDLASRR